MYLTPTESLVASVIFVGCLVLLCVALEKKETRTYYKVLDSEIKQILFEEEIGYKPIVKGKFTFKYKAWLMLNERKKEN